MLPDPLPPPTPLSEISPACEMTLALVYTFTPLLPLAPAPAVPRMAIAAAFASSVPVDSTMAP